MVSTRSRRPVPPAGTAARRRPGAAAGALLLGGLLAATAAVPAHGAVPMRYDIRPGSDVLISEIANGGAGATPQANRDSTKNFIEITNYGAAPMDISGWKIYRCGQTGGGYGPQAVVPSGTVLAPGDQFTAARAGSGYAADASYDTSLHEFGFGAFLEDGSGQRVDAVGFYHADVATDCADANGNWLQRGLQHRLDESHQRVANTGNLEQDWVVAARTVDAPNAAAGTVREVDNGLRITEFANGGSAGTAEQYVEITNQGAEPVDMGGYQLFRCGENGTQYVQIGSVAAGSVVAPGDSWVFAHEASGLAGEADATYATGLHFRDFGLMLLTADEQIVDRAGAYDNRNSACTDGAPVDPKLNPFNDEAYQRVADTGSNDADFAVTTTRTPGSHDPAAAPTTAAPSPHTGLKISEITAAGPAGSADEFVELANYGTEPINLSGFSAFRCYGSGQAGVGPNAQVPDLGNVVLAPGQTYLMVAAGAPAALLNSAQAVYAEGLNETEGYGMYITDATGALVDAVAVYDVNVDRDTPCRLGEEVRNYTRFDEGESVTRAQHTGDNELDFQMAPRTPGVLADTPYVDPTVPLPGETDPVAVDTDAVPGTPALEVDAGTGDGAALGITVADADDAALELSTRTAPLRPDEDVVVRAGVSPNPRPAALSVDGEQEVTGSARQEPDTRGGDGGYPFQRFEIPVPDAADLPEFTWTGTGEARNEVQLLAWTGAEWRQLAAAVPSADGDLTLSAALPPEAVTDGVGHVMVIDGPRTAGGLLDEVGVADQAFANPGSYDFALNHMTDTQFYSEGFRDVFRQMATWVIANEDARKIAYNSLTGDIVENWMNGNHSAERADREYAAARSIVGLLNEAGVPNGVLPGNHDNMWGYNNDKYNEYFPVEMFSEQPWYGEAWAAGDNSAHTDFFTAQGVEFMVINLPYRPSLEQMEWASAQAQAHPGHNVILATHSYLHTSGVRDNVELRYGGTGDAMWNTVVAPNDNVFLVFGGHYHGVVTSYADPVTGGQVDATEIAGDGAYAISNVGASGRTVVEMLADYQGYRSTQAADPAATRADLLDRDTGFQRLLQFDLDAGLMAVNTYSPTLDSFEAWKYDEPEFRGAAARYDAGDDEFVAKVSLRRDTTLAASGWTVTGPSTEADAASVPAGAEHRVTLPRTDVGQLVTVRAADAAGNTSAAVTVLPAAGASPGVPGSPTPGGPADPQPSQEPSDPAGGGTGDGGGPAAPDGGGEPSDEAAADVADLSVQGRLAHTGVGAGVLTAAAAALALLAAGSLILIRRRRAANRLP